MLRLKQSPFPGMNPFLEGARHWRGFHNSLASEIVAHLIPQLGDGYAAQLEIDSVMESVSVSESKQMRPDVAIFELPTEREQSPTALATVTPPNELRKVLVKMIEPIRRVTIKRSETDELVTIIEILSPTNKQASGLRDYRQKRHTIMLSDVHLVEIDLLRGGVRPGNELSTEQPYEYVNVVNRASSERISEIWYTSLDQPLPIIPIPLLYPDNDVVLDLNQVVQLIYERYGFGRLIDYDKPIPKPKLRPEMAHWWENRLNTVTQRS